MNKKLEIVTIDYPKTKVNTNFSSQIIVLGDFDGVHLGHQEVLRRTISVAERLNLNASIMTFHPHPRLILGQSQYKYLLTPLNSKIHFFKQLGFSNCYVVNFNKPLMSLSPMQFVEQILIPLNVNTIIVGFDFTFGNRAEGNADTLCNLSKGRFAVEVVRPYLKDNSKVSSRSIREYLLNGDIKKTTSLLGRPYILRGTVIHGNKLGRTIGFPTANLKLDEFYLIPKNGVYAVEILYRSQLYKGVLNIGVKPTVNDLNKQISIEVHIFDFHQEIYDEIVEILFIDFLRNEQKFSNIHELKKQIIEDVEKSKEIFGHLDVN